MSSRHTITAIIDVSKPIYRYLHKIHKTKSLFVENVRKLKAGEMKHLPGIQKRIWRMKSKPRYYTNYGSRNTTWKLLNLTIQWYGHVLCLEYFQYEKKMSDTRRTKDIQKKCILINKKNVLRYWKMFKIKNCGHCMYYSNWLLRGLSKTVS